MKQLPLRLQEHSALPSRHGDRGFFLNGHQYAAASSRWLGGRQWEGDSLGGTQILCITVDMYGAAEKISAGCMRGQGG